MTAVRRKPSKIFTNADYSERVPLWRALAEFTSEDLDDGLKANAAVINKFKAPFVTSYNRESVIGLIAGTLFAFSLIGVLIAGRSAWQIVFTVLLVAMLLIVVASQLWRYVRQYGRKTPSAPLELPHASDPHFDEFLGLLQKETGPGAYAFSRLSNRRVPFKRQQFFGRLRYFLLSEHSADRAMVMRFGSGLSLPADIFLRREQVDEMIATRRKKRLGGPGRNAKFRYIDAVIALIGDPRVGTLDLRKRTESVSKVKDWLDMWFKEHLDESGEIPRRDQLKEYAVKIVDHLEKLRPPEDR
jgi:hypothetical protein